MVPTAAISDEGEYLGPKQVQLITIQSQNFQTKVIQLYSWLSVGH